MSTTKTVTLIRNHGTKINSAITLLSNEFSRILHDENHPNVTDYFAENMNDFFSSIQSCRHLIARMTFLAKSKKDVETNFSLLGDELIELLNSLYSPTVSFDENFGRVNNELESDVDKINQAINLLESVHESQEPDVIESLSKLKSLVDFFSEKTADFTLVENYVSYVVNHFTEINEHLRSIEQLLPIVSFDETTEELTDMRFDKNYFKEKLIPALKNSNNPNIASATFYEFEKDKDDRINILGNLAIVFESKINQQEYLDYLIFSAYLAPDRHELWEDGDTIDDFIFMNCSLYRKLHRNNYTSFSWDYHLGLDEHLDDRSEELDTYTEYFRDDVHVIENFLENLTHYFDTIEKENRV